MMHKYNTTAAYKKRMFFLFSNPEEFKSYHKNPQKKKTGTITNT